MSPTNSADVCGSGWTKSEDGVFCTRDLTTTERCRLDVQGASDSCYGPGGRWEIAAAAAGAKTTGAPPVPTALSASCSRLLPLGETTGGEPELIIAIRESQEKEQALLNEWRAGGSSGCTDDPTGWYDIDGPHYDCAWYAVGTRCATYGNHYANQGKTANQACCDCGGGAAGQNSHVGGAAELLRLKIENIAATRRVLMQQLSSIYTNTQCGLSNDRVALQDQIAMILLAEKHLDRMKKQIRSLEEGQAGRQRMVEITNYEYDRYASHAGIFRIIALGSLFILAGIGLNAKGQTTVGNILIIIATAVISFLVVRRIWWNWWRSPMNWKEFEWDENPDATYETIFGRNRAAAEVEGLVGTDQAHKYHRSGQQFAPYN